MRFARLFLVVLLVLALPLVALAQAAAPAAPPLPSSILTSPELLNALAGLVVAVITYAAYALRNLVRSKVANQALARLLMRVDDAVFTAVRETFQVTVDAARAAAGAGGLPADVAKAAKDAAIAKAKSYLGADGLKLLGQVLGLDEAGVGDYLAGKVESAVRVEKMTSASAVALVPSRPLAAS